MNLFYSFIIQGSVLEPVPEVMTLNDAKEITGRVP